MKLDPLVDLEIDATDLSSEFRALSLLLFRYYAAKADAERDLDRVKRTLDEVEAHVYTQLKADTSKKHTEKSLEAEIAINQDVRKLNDLVLEAKHKLATLVGAVESMRAKKDCLVQLGADSRAERK